MGRSEDGALGGSGRWGRLSSSGGRRGAQRPHSAPARAPPAALSFPFARPSQMFALRTLVPTPVVHPPRVPRERPAEGAWHRGGRRAVRRFPGFKVISCHLGNEGHIAAECPAHSVAAAGTRPHRSHHRGREGAAGLPPGAGGVCPRRPHAGPLPAEPQVDGAPRRGRADHHEACRSCPATHPGPRPPGAGPPEPQAQQVPAPRPALSLLLLSP